MERRRLKRDERIKDIHVAGDIERNKGRFEFKTVSRTRLCVAESSVRPLPFPSFKLTRISVYSSNCKPNRSRNITRSVLWTMRTNSYKMRSSGREEEEIP
jgi:hypothetical protein